MTVVTSRITLSYLAQSPLEDQAHVLGRTFSSFSALIILSVASSHSLAKGSLQKADFLPKSTILQKTKFDSTELPSRISGHVRAPGASRSSSSARETP